MLVISDFDRYEFSYTDLLTLLIMKIEGNNVYLENGCRHVVKKSKSKSYELLKLMKQVKSYFFVLLMIDRMFQNHLSFRLLKILHNFKIHHKKRSVTLIYPYLKNHKCWYISTYMWCEERRTVRECF